MTSATASSTTNDRAFDLPTRLVHIDASQHMVPTDAWTDLGSFARAGSKVICYPGVSDPWFSANDTIEYSQRMLTTTAPRVPDTDWAQLYLAPARLIALADRQRSTTSICSRHWWTGRKTARCPRL